MEPFDYALDYQKKVNVRKQRELNRVGRGEQRVLLVEPYKSDILPHWRFKTPAIAEESSAKIHKMFLESNSTRGKAPSLRLPEGEGVLSESLSVPFALSSRSNRSTSVAIWILLNTQ